MCDIRDTIEQSLFAISIIFHTECLILHLKGKRPMYSEEKQTLVAPHSHFHVAIDDGNMMCLCTRRKKYRWMGSIA